MTNAEDVYGQLERNIYRDYQRYYNQHQLNQLSAKINCFSLHGTDPNNYYQCYDRIQTQTAKDSKAISNVVQDVQDDYKLCKHQCKTNQQQDLCLAACDKQLKTNVLDFYEQFYKNKLGSKAYAALKGKTH